MNPELSVSTTSASSTMTLLAVWLGRWFVQS